MPVPRNRWGSYVNRMANAAFAWSDFVIPRPAARAKPFRIHLEFNDFCNLKCIHCQRENPDAVRDSGQWTLDMVKRLDPLLPHCGFVGFAGLGEPFIAKHLLDTLEYVISRGPAPSVITNGTLITEEKAERMAGMAPLLISVSIDGATKATFEKIRKGADFDQVLRNMIAVRRAKERHGSFFPYVTIFWCMLKDNLGEMKELVDVAREIGAMGIQVQPVYDFGQPGARDDQWVTEAECEESIARLREHAAPHGILVRYVPLTREFSPGAASGATRYFCPNIWKALHLDPQGRMRICCMGDFEPVGNIFDEPAERLWNAPAMMSVRRALLAGDPPETCRKCYLLRRYDGTGLRREHLSEIFQTIRPDTLRL